MQPARLPGRLFFLMASGRRHVRNVQHHRPGGSRQTGLFRLVPTAVSRPGKRRNLLMEFPEMLRSSACRHEVRSRRLPGKGPHRHNIRTGSDCGSTRDGLLRYLSLRGLPCSISCPGDYCTACFHGEPLTPLPEKKSLEYRRRGKASFQTRGQI